MGDLGHLASRRRDLACLACLALASAALFAVLSLRPPMGSEVRYIEVGREMVESGDWVVPHLAYVPYLEKPVLAYWSEALCQALFGLHRVAARLPSIVASVVTLLVTWALGRELRGPAFALGASALLLSSAGFLLMGSVMTTDPLFAACLAVAWWAYWRHDRDPEAGWAWAFWAALGAAFLTKGPLAIALVAVSLGAFLLAERRPRDALSLHPVAGGALALAVVMAWNVPAWQRDPRFLEFFYWRQNVLAFVRSDINHAAPAWYYLPVVVGMLFPWSLPLLAGLPAQAARAAAAAWRGAASTARDAAGRSLRLYCLCIVVPGLGLLSLAGSKLSTYVLPLLPPIALLVADWIAERLDEPDRWLLGSLWAQSGALACAAVVAPRVLAHVAAHFEGIDDAAIREATLAIGAVAVGSVLCAVAARRARVLGGLAILGVAATGSALALDLSARALVAHADASRLVARLAPRLAADDRLVVDSHFASDYTIELALRRRAEILGSARELGMGFFTEATPSSAGLPDDPYGVDAASLPQSPWLTDRQRLYQEWRGSRRVWLIARDKEIAALRDHGLPVYAFASDGRRRIVSSLPIPEGGPGSWQAGPAGDPGAAAPRARPTRPAAG